MSGRLDAFKQLITGASTTVQKEMNGLEKLGIKFSLDARLAAQTEMELYTLEFLDDPTNDADAKISYISRLIILTYKYIAIQDNPKIAPLISSWHKILSLWSVLMDEKRKYYGNYSRVKIEEPYFLPNGTVMLRERILDMTPTTFQNMFWKYLPESPWQVENESRFKKKLTFTPVEHVVKNVFREMDANAQEEEREISESLEYFGNVEMIPRAWTVYSWMHREKHTFPNTPIVVNATVKKEEQDHTTDMYAIDRLKTNEGKPERTGGQEFAGRHPHP